MYAPTNWLTLTATGSYVNKSVTNLRETFKDNGADARRFSRNSSGFGDTKVGAMLKMLETNINGVNHHAHANLNLSIPTGSINGRFRIPGFQKVTERSSYEMQNGSGTFDAMPGVTYTGNYRKIGWGGQYMARLPMNTNNAGYSRGNKHTLTAWTSYEIAPWISTSARVLYETQGAMKGIDSKLVFDPRYYASNNPLNYGGRRLGVGVGLNLQGQEGILKGHRLSAEAIFPIYRNLHGAQLEEDWRLVAGWQYASSFLQ
jgi:hypothetical protein